MKTYDDTSKPLEHSYPLAVRLTARNLAGVVARIGRVLDLPVRDAGHGFVRLDNGSICVWVVEDAEAAISPLTIVLSASDVREAVSELLAREGVTLLREPAWRTPFRYEAELRADDWLYLVVGRTYDEDEAGIVPELETNLVWEKAADELAREMLRIVPVPFRGNARLKLVARGEALAVEDGEVEVAKSQVLRALYQVVPDFQRAALAQALAARGESIAEFVQMPGGDG